MTRYRTQIEPQPPGIRIATNENGVNVLNDVIGKPALSERITYDEVIPKFKSRSALGEIFNNPFTSSYTTFLANDVYSGSNFFKTSGKSDKTTFSNGAFLTNLFNAGSLVFPDVPLGTSSAAAMAAFKCISSVNKTEADTGAFVGEWSKTRLLHRDLGNSLLKLFTEGAKVKTRTIRSRKINVFDSNGNPLLGSNGKPLQKFIHDASSTTGVGSSIRTKNAANTYLAFRMGLMPLLSDLEGATKILMDNKSLRRTARGSMLLSGQSTDVKSVEIAYERNASVKLTSTRSINIGNGILYETTLLMRRLAQLGITRPLSSAWELMPWSFVADWFLNVGGWLDAIQPSGAHKTLAAWVSSRETIVHTAEVQDSFNYSDSGVDWSASWNGALIHVRTVKTRSPWVPTMPMVPPLGAGFNSTRSLDFAALILQRISNKF